MRRIEETNPTRREDMNVTTNLRFAFAKSIAAAAIAAAAIASVAPAASAAEIKATPCLSDANKNDAKCARIAIRGTIKQARGRRRLR
jgi:hypothetical protein